MNMNDDEAAFVHRRDELVQRLNDLLGKTFDPKETQAIPADRWDERTFSDTVGHSPSLQRMIHEYGKEEDFAEDFFRDLFNAAIKGDPKVREAEEMLPNRLANREMINHIADLDEFQRLRDFTVGDQYASLGAVESMDTEISSAYDRMRMARELAKAMAEALQEMEGKAQEAQDGIDAGDLDAAEASISELEIQHGKAVRSRQQTQSAAQAAARLSTQRLKKAVDKAADQAQDDADTAFAFGMDPGELKKMPFNERRELAKKLRNSRMGKFAKLIGSFRRLAASEHMRKVNDEPSEIVGVELGDDLTRLTTQEMVNLAIPETEIDFWRRYAEGQLLIHQLRGRERMGRGPIIVVCDESGSMTTPDLGGNSREAWSKALSLALCDQAAREGRDFHYVGFSSINQQWHTQVSKSSPITEVLKFTEHYWGGGTAYEPALTIAMEIASRYKEEHGKGRPDIVFISDDEYSGIPPEFSNELHALKTELGMRIWSIFIGNFSVERMSQGAMAQVSDNVRTISALVNDFAQVADLFRTL